MLSAEICKKHPLTLFLAQLEKFAPHHEHKVPSVRPFRLAISEKITREVEVIRPENVRRRSYLFGVKFHAIKK